MSIFSKSHYFTSIVYTRYSIVARRAWPAVQPLGRVRRASKGILHTTSIVTS